jgi:tetratricopeptide (TPR) repeat protein
MEYERCVQAADDALVAGDYEAVVTECTSALVLADNTAQKFAMYCTRSFGTVKAGRPIQGIEDAHAAITISPEDPDGYERRGEAYQALQQFAKARSNFEYALRLSPSDMLFNKLVMLEQMVTTYNNTEKIKVEVGTLKGAIALAMDTGQWENAADLCKQLVALKVHCDDEMCAFFGPAFLDAQLQCVHALSNLGKEYHADLFVQAEKVTELDPKVVDGLLAVGKVRMNLRQWDAAQDCFDRAGAVDPGNPQVTLALQEFVAKWRSATMRSDAEVAFSKAKTAGDAYFYESDYARAVEAYSLGLNLVPKGTDEDAILRCRRSTAHLRWGNPRDALNDANMAISIKPEWVAPFTRRGLAHDALKEWDSARKAFHKALMLDPDDKEVRGYLDVMEAKASKVAEAAAKVCDSRIGLFYVYYMIIICILYAL